MNRAGRVLWYAGAPSRAVLIAGIRVYRLTLGVVSRGNCRFYPSCSHYGEQAIRTRGALRGIALTTWRIMRCQPFSRGGVDPVPGGRTRHGECDSIILDGSRL